MLIAKLFLINKPPIFFLSQTKRSFWDLIEIQFWYVLKIKTKIAWLDSIPLDNFSLMLWLLSFLPILFQTFSTSSMKGNSKSSHIAGCCYSNGVLNGGPRLKPPVGRALVAPHRAVPHGAALANRPWRGVGPYGPTTFCRTLSSSL